MKHLIALGLLCGSLFFAGCESGVAERRTVVRRSYRELDADHVYYRDPYYHDSRAVRRTGAAYYPPRYRTYDSNPMHSPASDPDDYRVVRRVRVYR